MPKAVDTWLNIEKFKSLLVIEPRLPGLKSFTLMFCLLAFGATSPSGPEPPHSRGF
jgi:hypothetical protein